MKRIPVVIVAAVGAGLIGTLVMVVGPMEFNRCFSGDVAFDRCLRTILRGWEILLIVYFCAAIGGALNAQFFGRSSYKMWAKIGFALLGAILSTLYGGALAGLSIGIIQEGSSDYIFTNITMGSIFGFVFAFGTWIG